MANLALQHCLGEDMLYSSLLLFMLSFVTPANQAGVVNFEQFEQATRHKDNDTLYVVNFWATWCKPCVDEMPYFLGAQEKFSNQKVKVIFVSLNSKRELDKVNTFISGRNITEEVLLLDAGNPNDWIDKVDARWSGSIPATIMYHKGKNIFFKEGEFTAEGIESVIKNKLKQL